MKEKYGFLLSVSEYNFSLLPALVESNVKCAPNRNVYGVSHIVCMFQGKQSEIQPIIS